jgi:hypothetical protein
MDNEIYIAVDKNFKTNELLSYLNEVNNHKVITKNNINDYANKSFNHLHEHGFKHHDAFKTLDAAERFCNYMYGDKGHIMEISRKGLKDFITAEFLSKQPT